MKRHFAAAAFTLAVLLALALPAIARADNASIHTLPSPAWAVEFGLSNASLSSFDGATISLRQQKSPHVAWRYGLSVSANRGHQEATRTGSSSTDRGVDENTTSNHSEILYVTRISIPHPDARIRPWYGASFELGWSGTHTLRESRSYSNTGTLLVEQVNEDRGRGPWVTFQALLGLEWSPAENFALHAQYGQGLRHRWFRNEGDSRQNYVTSQSFSHYEGPSREFSLYGSGVRAGVSVFW